MIGPKRPNRKGAMCLDYDLVIPAKQKGHIQTQCMAQAWFVRACRLHYAPLHPSSSAMLKTNMVTLVFVVLVSPLTPTHFASSLTSRTYHTVGGGWGGNRRWVGGWTNKCLQTLMINVKALKVVVRVSKPICSGWQGGFGCID